MKGNICSYCWFRYYDKIWKHLFLHFLSSGASGRIWTLDLGILRQLSYLCATGTQLNKSPRKIVVSVEIKLPFCIFFVSKSQNIFPVLTNLSVKPIICNCDHGQLQPTGRNLGWVFNFRFGHLLAEHFRCCQVKLPNLKMKTQPKKLLGSLPLVLALSPLWWNNS